VRNASTHKKTKNPEAIWPSETIREKFTASWCEELSRFPIGSPSYKKRKCPETPTPSKRQKTAKATPESPGDSSVISCENAPVSTSQSMRESQGAPRPESFQPPTNLPAAADNAKHPQSLNPFRMAVQKEIEQAQAPLQAQIATMSESLAAILAALQPVQGVDQQQSQPITSTAMQNVLAPVQAEEEAVLYEDQIEDLLTPLDNAPLMQEQHLFTEGDPNSQQFVTTQQQTNLFQQAELLTPLDDTTENHQVLPPTNEENQETITPPVPDHPELLPVSETWFLVPSHAQTNIEEGTVELEGYSFGPRDIELQSKDNRKLFRPINYEGEGLHVLMSCSLPFKPPKKVAPKIQIVDFLTAPLKSARLKAQSGWALSEDHKSVEMVLSKETQSILKGTAEPIGEPKVPFTSEDTFSKTFLESMRAPRLTHKAAAFQGPLEGHTCPISDQASIRDLQQRKTLLAQTMSVSALEMALKLIAPDHISDLASVNEAFTHLSMVRSVLQASLKLAQFPMSAFAQKFRSARESIRKDIASPVLTASLNSEIVESDPYCPELWTEEKKLSIAQKARQARIDRTLILAGKQVKTLPQEQRLTSTSIHTSNSRPLRVNRLFTNQTNHRNPQQPAFQRYQGQSTFQNRGFSRMPHPINITRPPTAFRPRSSTSTAFRPRQTFQAHPPNQARTTQPRTTQFRHPQNYSRAGPSVPFQRASTHKAGPSRHHAARS